MEFTKEKTNIAKGVAICLMFAHHLYAFDDRLLNDNSYIPLIPFFNLEAYIGNVGNICVSMFLFLSGYGMYAGYLRTKKKTSIHYAWKKLKNFYSTFWLYFIVFVPIGIIFFQDVTLWDSNRTRYSREPIIFLTNFIGWNSTYNGEWWFIQVFVIILFGLFPIYNRLVKSDVILFMLISVILLCISFRFNSWGKMGFVFWQTSFALGMLFAKFNIFSNHLFQMLDQSSLGRIALGLLLCLILRFEVQSTNYDFLITPFLTYFSVRTIELLRLSKILEYLGIYSFALWLIHSFFCYYYFQDFIYAPKWSPLIFILLIASCLGTILGINYLFSHIKALSIFGTRQAEQIYCRFRDAHRW